MEQEIAAYAPASVSNVACGFDIMGFALDEPGDRVTLRFTQGKDVTIRSITGSTSSLPMDATRNTAGAPVIEMLRHCEVRRGVEIEIHKGLPAATGIGSSAASAFLSSMGVPVICRGRSIVMRSRGSTFFWAILAVIWFRVSDFTAIFVRIPSTCG